MYVFTTNTKIYIKTCAHILQKAEHKAAVLLLAAAVVLVGLYLYFLASAVVLAVEQQEVTQEMRDINSQLAILEDTYLQKKLDFTQEQASNLGLTHVSAKRFVMRDQYLGQARN